MYTALAAVLRQIIKKGRLSLVDRKGRRTEIGDTADANALPLAVHLNDRRVAFDLIRNPQLALGEVYMDGRITLEGGTIGDLLDLLARNIGTGFGGGYIDWIAKLRYARRKALQRNGCEKAKRNVAHHYDLSGQLYDLFLDSDKQYSCAFFERPSDTLEIAQLNKKRRLAAKLLLRPGQRVLDIGSGWGGLALHLARDADVDVTGVTLSEEQLKIANERAANAGLSQRLRFRLEDYRNTAGTFDRVVSVGMFEHVGLPAYETYFRRVASLLSDDGIAVIHSIGRSDGPGVTNPWIANYIFPGGYSPALSEVLPAVERAGLIVTDIEILRLHYAYTLAEWRRRFVANWERAKKLYDERFCRMWEFYLAGSEMAFRYQGHMVFQLQLAKRVDVLPLTRDYMTPPRKLHAAGSASAVAA
jgi:cyclopropane-fatty-acyl-phospholipid synthase